MSSIAARTMAFACALTLTACQSLPRPNEPDGPFRVPFSDAERQFLSGTATAPSTDKVALMYFATRTDLSPEQRKRLTRETAGVELQQAFSDCNDYFSRKVNARNVWGTRLRSVATVAGIAGGAFTPTATKGTLSAIAGSASGISSDISRDLVGSTALDLVKRVGWEQAEKHRTEIQGKIAAGSYDEALSAALNDIEALRGTCTQADAMAIIRERAAPKAGTTSSTNGADVAKGNGTQGGTTPTNTTPPTGT